VKPGKAHREQRWLPVRSVVGDVRRALGNPRHAWSSLRDWALLARHAGLRYAEVMRHRRELLDDREFQDHLARCVAEVRYVFSGLPQLYAVVRAVRPAVAVETGVASGMSSAHILRALAANGSGTLHSVDLPNVQQGSMLPPGRASGWIVPHSLRGRWKLHIGDSREILPALLETLDRVDLFLHDSDHSYRNMTFEFEQAYPRLAPGGVMMSDDVHLHTAWDDFCAKHGLPPGRVGNLGVTRKPSAVRTDTGPPRVPRRSRIGSIGSHP
jgi:predicted O-methyltransferase YrrM